MPFRVTPEQIIPSTLCATFREKYFTVYRYNNMVAVVNEVRNIFFSTPNKDIITRQGAILIKTKFIHAAHWETFNFV